MTRTEEFQILTTLKTFVCDQYVMYNKYEDQAGPKQMLQDYCKFIYAISVDGKSDNIDKSKLDYAESIYPKCLISAKEQAKSQLKHKITIVPPMLQSNSISDVIAYNV